MFLGEHGNRPNYLIGCEHKGKSTTTITRTEWRTIIHIIMVLMTGRIHNRSLILSINGKCKLAAGNNTAY